jgi:hypothetical protein
VIGYRAHIFSSYMSGRDDNNCLLVSHDFKLPGKDGPAENCLRQTQYNTSIIKSMRPEIK